MSITFSVSLIEICTTSKWNTITFCTNIHYLMISRIFLQLSCWSWKLQDDWNVFMNIVWFAVISISPSYTETNALSKFSIFTRQIVNVGTFFFLAWRVDTSFIGDILWHWMMVYVVFHPWSPAHDSWAVYITIYYCSVSTVYLRCNFHCRSLSFCLRIACCLSRFYPQPGATAFEEIQFEILACIFHEPILFLYPVLCCCWEDVSLTLHWNACGYWSLYVLAYCMCY